MEHTLSLSAIRARIEAVKDVIVKSNHELEDLAAAERMVLRFGAPGGDGEVVEYKLPPPSMSASTSEAGKPSPEISTHYSKNLTTLVLMAMRQAASLWLTSEDVRIKASELKGVDIPKGSIAPTLWNLKIEGLIKRDGQKVALASRIRDEGLLGNTSDSATKGVSETSKGFVAVN
jgi:hypothetical protein